MLRLGYINLRANGIASISQGSVIAFFGDGMVNVSLRSWCVSFAWIAILAFVAYEIAKLPW